MGPELIAVAAISGMALDAGSKIYKAHGEQAGQEFMAERDKRAAEIGRLRADQTDVHDREQLNTTLANLDAVRAAANIDPSSPTTAALKAEETRVSDRERMTKVANLRAQAEEDDLTARYRHKVGKQALIGGYLGAASSIGKGLGSAKFG